MPITGISLSAERAYESELDDAKGTPEATKFTLGTLDSRVYGRLKDSATSIHLDPSKAEEQSVTTTINSNDVAFNTVVYGLRGWENFMVDGEPVKFKTAKRTHGQHSYTVADPELVKLIPQAVLLELAEQIRKDNDLDEDEAKN
jgi:polyisoprenoid-binding protein YceI